MPESVEGPYLNMPTSNVDRVSESKRSRESHDEEKFFPELKRKIKKDDQDEEKQDAFDREDQDEEKDTKNPVVQKNGNLANADGPGLVVDIMV